MNKKTETEQIEAAQLILNNPNIIPEIANNIGLPTIQKLVKRIDRSEESDTKYTVSVLKDFFDVNRFLDEPRKHFMPKTELTRNDAEILGAKTHAYLDDYRSTIYRLEKKKWCRDHNITIEEFNKKYYWK